MSEVRRSRSEVGGEKAKAGKSRMPVRDQVSSGGVLFRRDAEESDIALIGLKGKTVWALPKGVVEPGEDPEQAAAREVQEETGLTGRCVGKIGEIEYWFVDRVAGHRIHKRVHFYLFEHTGGDSNLHDLEVEEVRWVPWKEALTRLTYPSERQTLEKALRILQQTE